LGVGHSPLPVPEVLLASDEDTPVLNSQEPRAEQLHQRLHTFFDRHQQADLTATSIAPFE
jgi:hypothetical protein